MKRTPKVSEALRAALVGWLPASSLCALAMVLDLQTFAVLGNGIRTSLAQATYIAAFVALGGAVLGPVIGAAFAFPLLAARARLGMSSRACTIAENAVVGSIVSYAAFRYIGGANLLLTVYGAIVGAICGHFVNSRLQAELAASKNAP